MKAPFMYQTALDTGETIRGKQVTHPCFQKLPSLVYSEAFEESKRKEGLRRLLQTG